MTVYRYSKAGLAWVGAAGLLIGALAGWFAHQPSRVPSPPTTASTGRTIISTPLGLVKAGGAVPTLEDVRRAWGIDGELHCAAGPVTPGAGSR